MNRRATMVFSGLTALSLIAMPAPVVETARTRRSDSMLAGLRFVTGSDVLRRTISATALLAGIDAAWFSLLVVLVTDELGLTAATFGLLLAVGSVGGLAGAALAPRITVLGGAALAAGVFGGMGLSLAAVWVSPSVASVTIALVVTSAGFAAWNVAVAGVRQRATPNNVLGRVAHRDAAHQPHRCPRRRMVHGPLRHRCHDRRRRRHASRGLPARLPEHARHPATSDLTGCPGFVGRPDRAERHRQRWEFPTTNRCSCGG